MVIEKTTGDWWLACNEKGQIGYVPGSYLQERLARNTALSYQVFVCFLLYEPKPTLVLLNWAESTSDRIDIEGTYI